MRSGSVARAMLLFLCGWLASAAAQTQYPSRMVKAIVPYTPGSSADLIARNLGPRLSEAWKVPFVVDNRDPAWPACIVVPGSVGHLTGGSGGPAPPDNR